MIILASLSSSALINMSCIEFHRVLTSNISIFSEIPATLHCARNFSRCCGDDRILKMSLRSYKLNKFINIYNL